MISYSEEIVHSWVRREPSSRALAALLGLSTPVTLRDIVFRLRQVETISLSLPINTDDDAAIGGHVGMELHSDGRFVFSGDMTATGFPSYHFAVQAWVGSGDGALIAAQKSGSVFGDDTPGPDHRTWHEPGTNLGIIEGWRSLRLSPSLKFHFQADLTGVLGAAIDVLTFAVKAVLARVVLGPYGFFVFVGEELIGSDTDLASPNVLAGVLVGGGVFLIAGPFGLIPAIIAGAATAALVDIEHRTLHDHEKDWARAIFGDKIRYDDIVVTNIVGADNRKFTVPTVGNKILMGLGPAWSSPTTWADPTLVEYQEPGSVFAHELTHAWQICNTSLVRVICNTSGDYNYSNGDANWSARSWRSFNNEQQAHIVDDWFGRHYVDLNSTAALRDQAYHYIADNILPGLG
jgi:hypothetical protein